MPLLMPLLMPWFGSYAVLCLYLRLACVSGEQKMLLLVPLQMPLVSCEH